MFHVIKASRVYTGKPYFGPTLNRAGYINREKIGAEFQDEQNAKTCAAEMGELNPVGFHVYNAVTKERVFPKDE
jgi:hypothetical protein